VCLCVCVCVCHSEVLFDPQQVKFLFHFPCSLGLQQIVYGFCLLLKVGPLLEVSKGGTKQMKWQPSEKGHILVAAAMAHT